MPLAMTPNLSLPHAAYAKISPTPYLAAHLFPASASVRALRPNGRTSDAFNAPTCHAGSLTHCAGSAVVRVGNTAVVCGINAEILLASAIPHPPQIYDPAHTASQARHDLEELEGLGLIVPNVELATGCSPAHLPGGAPSTTAQTLASRLLSLLLSSRLLDIDDLRITYLPPKHKDDEQDPSQRIVAYWVLYPSVHVMSLDGESSLFDCAWAATLAALRNVRLPRAWWNADLETVLCSETISESKGLKLNGTPIATTMGVFVAPAHEVKALEERRGANTTANGKELADGQRAWLIAAPDDFEDSLCRESVAVVVDCNDSQSTRVLRIEKNGGDIVDTVEMAQIIAAAEKRWHEWSNVLP